MLIILSFLQMLSLNEAYDFTCPPQPHWNIRAKSMCDHPRNYTCLFNVTFRVNVYREICNRPRTLDPGHKYVFQPNFTRAACNVTRYQPEIFKTNGYSDCTFQKSLCNSLGQETYEYGNTTVDRKCICNTERRYTFVMNSKKQCYCNPLTEDCSCHLGINPYNETVKLKDIKCFNDIKMTRSPYLGNMFNISRKIKIVEFDNYRYNVNNVPTTEYRLKAAKLIMILSFAYFVVVIIVMRIMRQWIKSRIIPRKCYIVECTDCSITIEWFIDVSDKCLSYELCRRPKGTDEMTFRKFFSEDVLEGGNGLRIYKLQNLLPETYYEFKLRSVYNDVKSPYSESITKQTLKLAPRKLDIVVCTDCSITIEWLIDFPDECLSYELDHRHQGSNDWTTDTFLSEDVLNDEYGRRMFTLQNLLPETYYEFKMRSVNKDVKSHYSESMIKQTLTLAPGEINIVECTDCSITIEWFIDVPDKCILYELNHRPNRTKDWSTTKFLSKDVLKETDVRRLYKLQNLKPETYYELKMRSVYKNDVKSHYSMCKTKQTLKLAPREFNIMECTDCSITIEWFIDDSDECLLYELDHRLRGTDDWSTKTFNEDGRRMYRLQNLKPETYYEFKMRSVYKDDVKSHYSMCKTKQTLKLGNKPKKEETFAQDQTYFQTSLPVSVTQFNIHKSENEYKMYRDLTMITSCIKICNTLLFTAYAKMQLFICNVDGTNIHHISLPYGPVCSTVVNNNTVAVSCTFDRIILIINIYTGSITNKIITSGNCYGIPYNDNNLYVVIEKSIIHVMDLTGKVRRTIPLPSNIINDITVDRDKFVCIDNTSIYCCSLDGKLIWKFKTNTFQYLNCVTTDDAGNVYFADRRKKSVVVVYDDGQRHRKLLTKSDSWDRISGIYFDKKENILLLCNTYDGNVFLFDVNHNNFREMF